MVLLCDPARCPPVSPLTKADDNGGGFMARLLKLSAPVSHSLVQTGLFAACRSPVLGMRAVYRVGTVPPSVPEILLAS